MRAGGYLLIDHRNNQGVSDELARRAGLPEAAGYGRVFEANTFTCAHCGTPTALDPRSLARQCFKCAKFICGNPACNGECHPFARRIDAALTALERQRHG